MDKKIIFLVGICILFAVGILFYSKAPHDSGSQNRGVEKKLIREFRGAYDDDSQSNGNVVDVQLVAEESEIEILEGHSTKVWTYEGRVPGEEIRMTKGDTLRVAFTNNLTEPTTIHWHGVRLPNAMDGVPGITQEPIAPGEDFVYEFTPKDAGTFWFHSHVATSEQIERGLYGTLIVEEEESLAYTQDVTWVIDDWRLQEDAQIYDQFNTGHDLMHDGRWGNVVTVNNDTEYVLTAQPGERIRLRLINPSNGRVYRPDFGALAVDVIAVDGMLAREPFNDSDFVLAPGNRADFDITIPTDVTDGKTFAVRDTFTRNSFPLATISVVGKPVQTPLFDLPRNTSVPLWGDAADLPIDKEYILNARRSATGIEWTMNDKAFPDYDPLTLSYGTFNKIRFTNESSRIHPMHVHGQFFKVVARGGVAVDEGYFRDTVLINARQTVDIALVPLDRGRWVGHCHTLEHAEAGMITVVEVK